MRKSNFTKFIQSLERVELQKEMEKLYDSIPAVKKYYSMELGTEKERLQLYTKAKKDISKYYTSKNTFKPRAPRIRRVQSRLNELSKISVFRHELADLYLFDVEKALDFKLKFYYNSKSLDNNLQGSFEKACKIIHEYHYQDLFIDQAEAIMKKAAYFEHIYWTFNKNFLSTFRNNEN